MKKILLLFISLHVVLLMEAQNKYLYKLSKVDSKTKLIGRFYNMAKMNAYNFVINNPDSIKSILKTNTLGNQAVGSFSDSSCTIYITQNNDIEVDWHVNLIEKTIVTGISAFTFNTANLYNIAKQYSTQINEQQQVFLTNNEFKAFVQKQKQDTNFLYYREPLFEYEGRFIVQYPKTQAMPTYFSFIQYLSTYLNEIVSSTSYRFLFNEDDTSELAKTHFIVTIMGSKKIFKDLEVENLTKGPWEKEKLLAIFITSCNGFCL